MNYINYEDDSVKSGMNPGEIFLRPDLAKWICFQCTKTSYLSPNVYRKSSCCK